MREALERVKRELGSEAVILGTRTLAGHGLRRGRVEITAAGPSALGKLVGPRTRAAPPAEPPAPVAVRAAPAPPAGPRVPPPLRPYYVELVQQEVAEELAEQIVQRAAAQAGSAAPAAIRAALRTYITSLVPADSEPEAAPGRPRRLALVGPSGSGKTTTLAKLAAHRKLRGAQRIGLLSLDMHRLAAHEQLRHYAELLEIPLHTAQTIGEVRAALQALHDVDLLLIDTLGVGLREQARFARLATLLRAARPDETHLVLPASLAAPVQQRVVRGFAPLGISRLVLTRLDDAVGFGVILNVMQQLNMTVSYVTTGQNVPNDIEKACGARVAELLLARGA
jgi:flagellar biosynthesis protein FlhF